MGSRGIVAVILACGVTGAVFSGAIMRHLLWTPDQVIASETEEMITLWKDVLLVIVGALAGHISGMNGGTK